MTKPPEFSDTDFKKSTFSANTTDCVEAALRPSGAALRDSKNPGPRLRFGVDGWTAFLNKATTDHFGREIDYTALQKKKPDPRAQQAG